MSNPLTKPVCLYYSVLTYRPENLARLHELFEVIELPDPSHDTPELLARAELSLAPLGWYFGPDKMDACPKLRVIGSNTTGHPHIAVDEARVRGLAVVTLKDHQDFLDTITPTAELTFGLIIALTRNLLPAARSVVAGHWQRWPFGGRAMLSSLTLGIIGLGRLGSMTARMGLAADMRVVAYDRQFLREVPGVEKLGSMAEVVAAADVASLHIPHEPENEKIIDRALFETFRDGAWFVNTSRGELVDEDALLWALESGKLAGAACDVLDGEFVPGFENRVSEHPLVRYAASHDNLILTPHIGGSTEDAWGKTQAYTIEQMRLAWQKDQAQANKES